MKLAEEDLHIYILDTNDIVKSRDFLIQEIKKRTRKDKEFWFIDIAPLKTLSNAKSMLDNLTLDIDDDVYTFIIANNSLADIWELYKQGPGKNTINTKLGTWKQDFGLSLTTLNKWHRRGNLTVSISTIE